LGYLLAVDWAVRTRAPASRKEPRKKAADAVGRIAHGQEQGRRPSSLTSDSRLVGITEWKRYSTRKEGHSFIINLRPPREGWGTWVVRICPLHAHLGRLFSLKDNQ
jgi:hypothetical protein